MINELALFAGAGGGILGGMLAGFKTVCAVEIDDYCRRVLLARQSDGVLPIFPIWDDVRTFDGRPWRGEIDVVTGGFPCQDISACGRGAGIHGERSGLVWDMLRIIEEVRPSFVFAENSPNLRVRGLDEILEALAFMGFDARWGCLGAWHVGAPHRRDRLWIFAYADSAKLRVQPRGRGGSSGQGAGEPAKYGQKWNVADISGASGWPVKPGVGRVANGVAHRVDRLKAIGNGQVPRVARLAWEILSNGHMRKM